MSDYISREAVLLHLNDIWLSATPTDNMYDDDRQLAMVRCMGLNDAMDVVKEITAADVRPVVRATWIVKEMQALFPGMDEHPVFACSECGYQIYDLLDNLKERHHFCQNCGADMRPEPPKEE